MDNWDWNFITGKLITNFPSESLCAAWLIQENVGLMAFNCKLVCCNARETKTIMVWGFALSFIWQNDTNFITTDTGDSNNKNIFIYYILFPLKWIAETQANWTSHWDRSTLWRLLIVPAQYSVSHTHECFVPHHFLLFDLQLRQVYFIIILDHNHRPHFCVTQQLVCYGYMFIVDVVLLSAVTINWNFVRFARLRFVSSLFIHNKYIGFMMASEIFRLPTTKIVSDRRKWYNWIL